MTGQINDSRKATALLKQFYHLNNYILITKSDFSIVILFRPVFFGNLAALFLLILSHNTGFCHF